MYIANSISFQEKFGSSLSVMMKALQDLQTKGDLLAVEIQKQKETLEILNSKLLTSSQNLTKTNKLISSREKYLTKIEANIQNSQKIVDSLGTKQET